MYYPTIVTESTQIRHVVKDKNYCICGSKYNAHSTFYKADFKRIEFKQGVEITCPSCKSQSIIS